MFNYEVKFKDIVYGTDCTVKGYVQADSREKAFKTVVNFYSNCYSVTISESCYDVIEIRDGELLEWKI